MKKLAVIAFMLLICGINNYSSEMGGGKVYVCTGSRSQCYHRTETCRGLNTCKGEIKAVSLKTAQSLGRRECKICYKKK